MGKFAEAVHVQINTTWDELELQEGASEEGTAKVTCRSFSIGDEDDPTSIRVVKTFFEPGFVRPVCQHKTDLLEVVLEGTQQVGRHWENPGHVRLVKAGTAYGPSTSGPEGSLVLTVYRGQDWAPVFLDD